MLKCDTQAFAWNRRLLPAGPPAIAAVLAALTGNLMACGASRSHPATASSATMAPVAPIPAPPASAPTVPLSTPSPLGLPHDAALVASVDLVELVVRVDDLRKAIENKLLGISQGTLEAYLAGVGFDRNRPCSIAATGPDNAQRQAVERLGTLAASAPLPWAAPPPGATTVGLADALGPFASSHAASWRILLPATDPRKLHAAIADVLMRQQWLLRGGAFVRPATGLSDFWLPMVVTLTNDAANVAIDIDVGASPRPEDAVASLRNAMREARDSPLSLDGDVLRVEWVPSGLAILGALQTVMPGAAFLSSDVERGGFPRSSRDKLALDLVTEAAGVPRLASDDKGPYFDRIEMTVSFSPFQATVRAHPGGGFTMPAAAAWRTSRSLALDDRLGSVDVSTALVAAWTFPVEEGYLLWLTRETAPMGWLVALPHLLVAAPVVQADELITMGASALGPKGAPAGAPWATWIKHFERVGVDLEGGEPTFIGVLPAATPRTNAECALAPKTPCDAKARLTFGAASKGTPIASTVIQCGFPAEPYCRYVPQDWPFYAKIVSVDGRLAVLATRPGSPVAAKPKAQDLGPFHLSLLLSHFVPRISGSLPERVVGDVHEDSGTVVFHVAAPGDR
jgi:hypothetical protein